MEAAISGYTLSDGTPIDMDRQAIEFMQNNTKLYSNDEVTNIEVSANLDSTKVSTVSGGTLDISEQRSKEGFNPVSLNFACSHAAGGGVKDGGFAQEESICLQSNYMLALDPTRNPHLNEQLSGPYHIPEFGAIYTPKVTVFRDSFRCLCFNSCQGGAFIRPRRPVSLIASAAYNWSASGPEKDLSLKAYERGMEKKIRAILKVAAKQGHDCVVLGAFGCGAFRKDNNTPKIVASIFAKLLKTEFAGVFKDVTFAVLPGLNNLEVFSQHLNFTATRQDLEQAKTYASTICSIDGSKTSEERISEYLMTDSATLRNTMFNQAKTTQAQVTTANTYADNFMGTLKASLENGAYVLDDATAKTLQEIRTSLYYRHFGEESELVKRTLEANIRRDIDNALEYAKLCSSLDANRMKHIADYLTADHTARDTMMAKIRAELKQVAESNTYADNFIAEARRMDPAIPAAPQVRTFVYYKYYGAASDEARRQLSNNLNQDVAQAHTRHWQLT